MPRPEAAPSPRRFLGFLDPCLGKSLFKVSSFEALTKRQLELEKFLKDCVVRKDILSNSQFNDFLEIEKHSPELVMNTPTKLADYCGIPLGVRDFHYKEDDIYMLMDCINGDVFEINETSKKIIDEIVTGSDIKIIYKKFNNIDNNITIEDIIKFVEVLYDNGLVRILQ